MKKLIVLSVCVLIGSLTNAEDGPHIHSFHADGAYWEVLPDMPTARAGTYVGYCYNPAVDTITYIHAFGGDPGPSTDHYVWDDVSWQVANDSLPAASGYGGHCTVNNLIYMVGGAYTEGVITIYEPGAGYTTRALPVPAYNNAVTVGQDRYIYSIGGGHGFTSTDRVILYDTQADSFLPVTQLPASEKRSCASAGYFSSHDTLVPDTIIVAAGFDTLGLTTTTLLGIIWQSDPGNITWSTGPPMLGQGIYLASAGVWGNTFFIIGGGYDPQMLIYIPGSGWFTMPPCVYNIQAAGCTMAPAQVPGGIEGVLYICGGIGGAMFLAFHTGMIISTTAECPAEHAFTRLAGSQVQQNPVVDCAHILFYISTRGTVRIKIFDTAGRLIADQQYSDIAAGKQSLIWDCTDRSGQPVPSGVYIYRLETDDNVWSGQITVLR